MVTAGLYILFFIILIISIYRRTRGLDDMHAPRSWFQQMKDREETERSIQQAYDEAERRRAMTEQSSDDYRRQRDLEILG